MEKSRMGSRSIILDPVHDRIEHIRYNQHKRSLEKISHGHPLFLEGTQSAYYGSQLQKYKRSTSYVKLLFDNRTIQNKNLVKKMLQIDRRKSPFRNEQKQLPSIYSKKEEKKQEELRKENQKLVERILEQRQSKGKEEIIKECKAYDKYKKNLRKIKGSNRSFYKLKLLR